jgi:hypothetical protein
MARVGDDDHSPMTTPDATPARATPRDANRLVERLLRYGLGGHGSLEGSRALAGKYASNPRFADDDARVRALIRSHTLMNFGTGFVTGLGGLITLPVAIPAAMTASWVIHTRLSGAIATLHGHDIDDDRVQTFVLITLLGDSGQERAPQRRHHRRQPDRAARRRGDPRTPAHRDQQARRDAPDREGRRARRPQPDEGRAGRRGVVGGGDRRAVLQRGRPARSCGVPA